MRYQWLILILFLSVCAAETLQAQDSPGAPSPGEAAQATAHASKVAPDAAVITIEGLCSSSFLPGAEADLTGEALKSDKAHSGSTASPGGAPDAGCKTLITREQFEILVNALSPKMPPEARARLAERYPEMLLQAEKVRDLGLASDRNSAERIKFSYLQVLGKVLNQHLQEQANSVTDAEVEQYYKEHPASFQRVDLMRVFILNHKVYPDPSNDAAAGVKPAPAPEISKEQAAADEAAMRAEAERIRKEAVAGGSFEKLQARAYKFAQDPDDTPDYHMGKMTPDQVPAEYQKAIFDLPIGKVSELEPAENGWHIFKVVSKETVPLSEAKPIVQRLRMRDATEALKASIKVQLSDDYFGSAKDQTKPAGWR